MEAAARPFSLTPDDVALNTASTLVSARPQAVESKTPPPDPFDREAFSEVVIRHRQAVYGYLRARLLEPADADDLCQEVFLCCYSLGRVVRREEELRFWLIGIARNYLHEYIRRVKRRREVAWTELCLELDALVQQPALVEDEAIHFLPVCVDSLGKSAREALDMQYHAKLKLSEIGVRLKRSEGAVKLLLHRARQALKNCLDGKLAGRS